MPRIGTAKRRAIARTPNENSVVVWIKSRAARVLLGGDLEASPNPAVGWTAVINSASEFPERARIFKVPHHGSANADDPRVWEHMLFPQPIAALTQFASGTKPLPSKEDLKRLSARTRQLYCTGPPNGWTPKRRSAAVERTLREMTRKRRAITGPMGHIRLRVSLQNDGNPVSIFLGNPAVNLAA